MKTKSVFIVSLLVALSVLSFSQSRETGAILGKVTDDQKDPLLGGRDDPDIELPDPGVSDSSRFSGMAPQLIVT